MNKPFYESWTFWGVLLLALEGVIKTLGIEITLLEALLVFFGIFLTGFGFRRAMD